MLANHGLSNEVGRLECISAAISDFVKGTELLKAWEEPKTNVEQLEVKINACAGEEQYASNFILNNNKNS